MTLWLDQVLASPVVGIVMEPWMGFQTGIWTALEVLGEKWRTDGNGSISIQTQDLDVHVIRDTGLYLRMNPNQVICGMRYNMSLRERPGTLPELSVAKPDMSFSYMQNAVLDALVDLFEVAPRQRRLVRIGHLAECRLVKSDVPPGVGSLLEHFESVWPGRLKGGDASFLAELSSSPGFRDQCHHFVSFSDYDRPEDLTFRLDWQRVWLPPSLFGGADLIKELRQAATLASTYFQDFGEGNV